MKSKTNILFFLGTIMFLFSTNLSGQMVGGNQSAAPTTQTATATKGFFIKFGAAIPGADFKSSPSLTDDPAFDGKMGAKTGMYIEGGFSINLFNAKKAGFYYFPIVAAYWQTALDWSDLGGIFEDKSIYTKAFKMIDIGQRYGVWVKPVDELTIGLYYRPGLVIPLDFEIADGGNFLYTGTMSTSEDAPIFQMSHTAGLEVRYSILSLSAELYSAHPTMDVTVGIAGVNSTSTGKVPVKLMNLSLSVYF